MKKKTTIIKVFFVLAAVTCLTAWGLEKSYVVSSSHREAPLIANDPQADNTDVYAFRCPDDTNSVCLIANYIPFELPMGGPNYYWFGTDVRYEIHVKNDAATTGDDITYRFTFTNVNQDPTTFFNIRLGQQNLKTTFTCQRSIKGGAFTTIATGNVPPTNIGPRSIDAAGIGLGMTYDQLIAQDITTASSGETIYCGPADDPFFVDLGGIFDLGQTRAGGTGINAPRDGLAGYNCHVIAIKVPISTLQKDGKDVTKAVNILDPNFVIGVWASSSRQQMRTLVSGDTTSHSGKWVQISRLGMPLTNEAVIPVGRKDYWNSLSPYNEDTDLYQYFYNPELALYMDDRQFGSAIPALKNLRVQTNSFTALGNLDFGNGHDGASVLIGNPLLTGTALDPTIFGKLLLKHGDPRSIDLWPIFYTGVPNLAPYQLAVGKPVGDPLAHGKPFINNFLPTLGDMLRLNMAVPVTPRTSADFSSEGIVKAAELGLLDARFNTDTTLQFIPNMDGFPNGRRLEDDVTRIELQAVSGVAMSVLGLWYDDYNGTGSPVTPDLLNVLGYTTGVEHNDVAYKTSFPYVATPWSGYNYHFIYQ